MSRPSITVSHYGAPKLSRSEAMMEIIRHDLRLHKPTKWADIRQRYSHMLDLEEQLLPEKELELKNTSKRRIHLSDSMPLELNSNHEKTSCRAVTFETKRQQMARVLNMMGSSVSSPRYSINNFEDIRLPTRGSRRSLDPQMLRSCKEAEFKLASPREVLRRRSLVPVQLTSRLLSIKRKGSNQKIDRTTAKSPAPDELGHQEGLSTEITSASRKPPIKGRFKKLSKLIILLLRGWRLHSKRVHEILDGFGSLHTDNDSDGEPADLMFDLSDYRIVKEGKVSSQNQEILRKHPRERSEKEINKLMSSFRNYRSILTYPPEMQRLIAERCWYESITRLTQKSAQTELLYGAKKVLVREGHPPMRFYFILSGSAVVCVMDENSRLKTIVELGRGDSFGELAIINRSNRQSTVISQDHIELLCLTDNDFEDVFMSGGLNNLEDSFLRSLWYMEDWPIDKLIEHPDKALVNYFQKNTVLVPDSNVSDWLYIIKSGSCELLKCLQKGILQKPKPAPKFKEFRQNFLDKLRSEDPKYLNQEQLLQLKIERQMETVQRDTQRLREGLPEINVPASDTYQQLSINRQPSEFFKRKPEREKSQLERLISKKPHMGVSNKSIRSDQSTSSKTDLGDITVFNDHILVRQTGHEDKESRDLVRRGAINAKRPPQKYSFSPNSVFVEVGTLTKGDAFGLHELVYRHQPSMCLVSQGSEVILINKSFYLQHAPESLIQKLRGEVIAFPADHKLQVALDAGRTWEHTRKQSLRQAIERLQWKRVDVNDARTRYPKTTRHF